ncbi:MAG: hypothetical protein EA412_08910 [Chitinophagaceae bacterium]|nr:MAG: hypothetical protein EA412_08910 [Chitinophagaceae bacterium]
MKNINRKILILSTILFAVLVINIGCEKKDSFQNPCFAAEQLKDPVAIEDEQLYGKWIFESFQKAGSDFLDKETPPFTFKKKMQIEITDEEMILWQGPVNSGWTEFSTFENQKIQIQTQGSTQVGRTNLEAEWEDRFFSAFNETICYLFEDDELILNYKENNSWFQMNFYRK